MNGRVTIRFTKRKVKGSNKRVYRSHFYIEGSGKVFTASCGRDSIFTFLNMVNGHVLKRSPSGSVIQLSGNHLGGIVKRLVIYAGVRQCLKNPVWAREIMEIVTNMGEFETVFWYSKMLSAYEKRGYWGVCRVAKAIRALYGVG